MSTDSRPGAARPGAVPRPPRSPRSPRGDGPLAPRRDAEDVWRGAPTSELTDQVLPRWFVLLGLVLVVVVAVAVAVALLGYSTDDVPVAERRPPPDATYTTAPGAAVTGDAEPTVAATECAPARGIRVAGTDADSAVLTEGLDALCAADLPGDVVDAVRRFAAAGGVVRFAQLQDTGVDSTARLDGTELLLNARFAITEPDWIAPLVVHDLVTLEGEVGTPATALDARRAEAAACAALFAERRPSRACDDADALLALDDPAAALRTAGFR